MRDQADGLRVGREVAGMAADAVASSLDDVVMRLRARRGAAGDAPAAIPPGPGSGPGPEGATRTPAGTGPLAPVAELLGAVLAEVLPAVLARVDIDATLDRVDVQRLVERIDVEEIVARIDLDAVAARVDLDALVARLDVDAIVRRIDLAAATAEALEAVDIGEIVRDSTATIGSDVVEDLRRQAMRADDIVARAVDRLLRRREPRRTALDPEAIR